MQRRYGAIGGLRTAARHDTRELTAPARQAFEQRFLDEVDPARTLPEAERTRRAAAARRGYFAELTARSIVARRKRKGPVAIEPSTEPQEVRNAAATSS